MKKETVNAIVQHLSRWIGDRAEEKSTEQLPKDEVRAIMEDEMGWVDERTQDKWMRILSRRKVIIPVNANVFFIPNQRKKDQKTLVQFDIPEVKAVKR